MDIDFNDLVEINSNKEDPQAYCKSIAESIPKLRNSFAHGSSFKWEFNPLPVALSCRIINLVFERHVNT